ncbi:hypothetical protein HELRODRAFT_170303 [Helobdella robusta]|uniref:FH2 domain-containing protein n=1 Tax=Helobdella robusta TaxID=6412 RepID=T1F2W5_HELRO|nr:hypothetical protein HELRODRAFT_170303 [Helobdella robusta]ESO07755.1 hypothetical protein HELRODRAFT_170303 [Helobdella robusta]
MSFFLNLYVFRETSRLNKNAELSAQIEHFERKSRDDDERNNDGQMTHVDLFCAIMEQIEDTPYETTFLLCLQGMHFLDPSKPTSELAWDYISRIIGLSTTIENHSKKGSEKLLDDEMKDFERESSKKFLNGTGNKWFVSEYCQNSDCACLCHSSLNDSPYSFKEKVKQAVSNTKEAFLKSPSSPPPPPPPPLPPPPPPPPPPPLTSYLQISEELNFSSQSPCSRRRQPLTPFNGQFTQQELDVSRKNAEMTSYVDLFKRKMPVPTTAMKRLQWSKIPANTIIGKKNIWTDVLKNLMADGRDAVDSLDANELTAISHFNPSEEKSVPCYKNFNFLEIESMFGKKDSNCGAGLDAGDGRCRPSKKKTDEVILLDSKRSLNVNIFLHQIRIPHKEFIEQISQGSCGSMTVERLKNLFKILPEQEELEIIKNYQGDPNELGRAEQFFHELIRYPRFGKSVETLVVTEEFSQTVDTLKYTVASMIQAAKDIIGNVLLREVFKIVLIIGNFLNRGVSAGDTVAFRLSSLSKLLDVKSNLPGISLINYIAKKSIECNREVSKLPNQLSWIREVAQYSIESVLSDASSLNSKVETVKKNKDFLFPDFAEKMETFVETATEELTALKENIAELERVKNELAEYFCEDEKSFKMDECIESIGAFVLKFEKAFQLTLKLNYEPFLKENSARKIFLPLQKQNSLDEQTSLFKNRRFSGHQDSSKLNDSQTCPNLESLNRRSTIHAEEVNINRPTTLISSNQTGNKLRKTRQSPEIGNSKDLLEFLSNTGFQDNQVKMRKQKTPVDNSGVIFSRERSTPSFDKDTFLDKNDCHRRSMIEPRTSSNYFDRTSLHEHIADKRLEVTKKQFSQPAETIKNIDSLFSKLVDDSIKKDFNGNVSLTQKAFLKHVSTDWNKNTQIDENSGCDPLKQKITLYRENNNLPMSMYSNVMIASDCEQNILDVTLKSAYSKNGQNVELRKSTDMSIGSGVCSTSIAPTKQHLLNKDYKSMLENGSFSSGTDEGFESMRNSVNCDDTSRASPSCDQANISGRNKTAGTNKCATDDGFPYAHSMENLMKENEMKMSQTIDNTIMRGATSVVSVQLTETNNDLCNDAKNENFSSLREVSTPNKSSTSTLKSSGSGFHFDASSCQSVLLKEEQPQINDINQRHPTKMLNQTVVEEEPNTKLIFQHRARRTSTCDNSSDNRKSKPLVDIGELSARLSQPKRPVNVSTTGSITPHTNVLHNNQPTSKSSKAGGHSKNPNISVNSKMCSETFVRGSPCRTTLPANVFNTNKKRALANQNIEIPPEPPIRTTSILPSKCEISALNCCSAAESAQKCSSNSQNFSQFYEDSKSTDSSNSSEKKASKTAPPQKLTTSSPSRTKSLFKKFMNSNSTSKNTNNNNNNNSSATPEVKMARPVKPGTALYKR